MYWACSLAPSLPSAATSAPNRFAAVAPSREEWHLQERTGNNSQTRQLLLQITLHLWLRLRRFKLLQSSILKHSGDWSQMRRLFLEANTFFLRGPVRFCILEDLSRKTAVTCVEASSQRGPGFVVLPQVPQVPVTLVLHQAYHLFICTQDNQQKCNLAAPQRTCFLTWLNTS